MAAMRLTSQAVAGHERPLDDNFTKWSVKRVTDKRIRKPEENMPVKAMYPMVVGQRIETVENRGLSPYFLKALAVLVLWASLLAPVAADKRPETGHVAVFFSDERGMFAWPIFTVSKSVEGNVSVFAGKFEVSLCASHGLACDEYLKKCADTEKPCSINKTTVQTYHGMKSVPKAWFDASGEAFSVTGSVLVPFAFGQGGEDLLGFTIVGEHFADERKKSPIVLADRSDLIRTKSHTQLDAATRSYVRQLIEKWKVDQDCLPSDDSCDELNRLTAKRTVKGEVISFALSGGRRLEYLTAKTAVEKGRQTWPHGKWGDYLNIESWRLRTKEGKTLDLQFEFNHPRERVSTEWVECVSQCPFEWSPEVVEIGDRIFVVGRGSGGTVGGYYAFELIGSTLKNIVAYIGGS